MTASLGPVEQVREGRKRARPFAFISEDTLDSLAKGWGIVAFSCLCCPNNLFKVLWFQGTFLESLGFVCWMTARCKLSWNGPYPQAPQSCQVTNLENASCGRGSPCRAVVAGLRQHGCVLLTGSWVLKDQNHDEWTTMAGKGNSPSSLPLPG